MPSDSPSNLEPSGLKHSMIWDGCHSRNKKNKDGTWEWPMSTPNHELMVEHTRLELLAYTMTSANDGECGPWADGGTQVMHLQDVILRLWNNTWKALRNPKGVKSQLENYEARKLFNFLGNFRSGAMSKVRACVKDHYEWPTPGERQAYVDRLLDGDLFLMEDENAPGKAMFMAPILGKCIGKVFFSSKGWSLAKREPLRHYFEPLRIGVIAFMCTMIRHAIYEMGPSREGVMKFEGHEVVDKPFEHYLDEWEFFPENIQPRIANSIRKKAILYAGWKVPLDYRDVPMPRSNRYDPSDFADIIARQDVGDGGRYAGRSKHNSSAINFNTELFDDSNQSNRSASDGRASSPVETQAGTQAGTQSGTQARSASEPGSPNPMRRKNKENNSALREKGDEGEDVVTDEIWEESPHLEIRWSSMEDPTRKKKIRVGFEWTWSMLLSVLLKPGKRPKAKTHCISWRLQDARDVERENHGEIRSITAWDAWLKRMEPNTVVFMSDAVQGS